MDERDDAQDLTPDAALQRLIDGHRRFLSGEASHPGQSQARRAALRGGQHPFAAVLSCADSRVPPEILFDQGLGDLFVIRSAGHVLDHALLGTIEFGVGQLLTPLILVLGHSRCGAVAATLRAVTTGAPASGTDVDTLVEAITPAVEEATSAGGPDDDVLLAAVGNNVELVVATLLDSPVVSSAVRQGKVRVVGAVYHIGTGNVELL